MQTCARVTCTAMHKVILVVCIAVTDMFYDLPYDPSRNNAMCFERFGVVTQYDWAAST